MFDFSPLRIRNRLQRYLSNICICNPINLLIPDPRETSADSDQIRNRWAGEIDTGVPM